MYNDIKQFNGNRLWMWLYILFMYLHDEVSGTEDQWDLMLEYNFNDIINSIYTSENPEKLLDILTTDEKVSAYIRENVIDDISNYIRRNVPFFKYILLNLLEWELQDEDAVSGFLQETVLEDNIELFKWILDHTDLDMSGDEQLIDYMGESIKSKEKYDKYMRLLTK